MNRLVALGAVLTVATTLAQGQRGARGGPTFRGAPVMRSTPASRFAPVPRGPMVRFASPAGTLRRGFGPSGFTFGHIGGGGVRFRSVPFCDPTFISCQFTLASQFHHRRRHFRPFFSPFGFGTFGAPFGFGSVAYGGYPIFSDYPQADYGQVAQPAPQPIIIYAQPPEEQRAPPEPAPQPQPAAAPAPEPMKLLPTLLVFRDQHREEVTNYAITGETVYVFTENGKRKKIALSDLDLPATVKVNDERGVDFRVPAHKGT